MINWLASNLGTIIVTLILVGIVAAILLKLIKDRKEGKTSCGCGCAHCGMNGQCHKKKF